MRDWKNRHVSRVDKPDYLTWDDLRPRCPLCGFKCMTALNCIDFIYILQDHYTVCRERRNMYEDLKGWQFTGKPFLRFAWDEKNPHVFWVWTMTPEGERVLTGGYGVFERTDPMRTGPAPAREDAYAAARRFVVAWESAAELLGMQDDLWNQEIKFITSSKYRGDWIGVKHDGRPVPDEYYIYLRPDEEQNVQILAAMLGDRTWAEHAWRSFKPGRTGEETLVAVSMAFAQGELARPDVPITGQANSDSRAEIARDLQPVEGSIFDV